MEKVENQGISSLKTKGRRQGREKEKTMGWQKWNTKGEKNLRILAKWKNKGWIITKGGQDKKQGRQKEETQGWMKNIGGISNTSPNNNPGGTIR